MTYLVLDDLILHHVLVLIMRVHELVKLLLLLFSNRHILVHIVGHGREVTLIDFNLLLEIGDLNLHLLNGIIFVFLRNSRCSLLCLVNSKLVLRGFQGNSKVVDPGLKVISGCLGRCKLLFNGRQGGVELVETELGRLVLALFADHRLL